MPTQEPKFPDRPRLERVFKHVWRKPLLSEELGEVERTAVELNLSSEELKTAFERGQLIDLDDQTWDSMQNTESVEAGWTLEKVLEFAKEKPRDAGKILKGFEKSSTLPAPVVLFREGRRSYLVAGNTRLLICRVLKERPRVLAVHL